MPADDELTTLLRRGFAQATADLDPSPDLVNVIHRRHVSARRRRVAVAVAVPAAALAAGAGFALAGPGTANHTPNHTAVAVAPPRGRRRGPRRIRRYRSRSPAIGSIARCYAATTAPHSTARRTRPPPRSANRRTRGRGPGSGRTE